MLSLGINYLAINLTLMNDCILLKIWHLVSNVH